MDRERAVPLREFLEVPAAGLRAVEDAAWLALQEGALERARRLFRGLKLLEPEALDHHRGDALAATELGDHMGARESLLRAETLLRLRGAGLSPRMGEVLALLSKVLLRAKQPGEAKRLAERALALAQGEEPWVSDLRRGTRTMEQELAKAPRPSATEVDAAMEQGMRGVFDGHGTLAEAFGYDDDELMQLYDQGETLLGDGAFDGAKRIFVGLVALDPTLPLFHLALATTAELLGEVSAAAHSFAEAVRCCEGVPDGGDLLAGALVRRSRFRLAQGDFDGAFQDAGRALALNPPYWPADEKEHAKELVYAAELGRKAPADGGGDG